jgi:hypothetical protein
VVVGDESYQGHWSAEQACGHTGETIEALLGWRIEESRATERGKAVGAGKKTLSHMPRHCGSKS